ncbi:MAG: von Willebrand factor type A domain-containing protein [Planctomycetota bacterium]
MKRQSSSYNIYEQLFLFSWVCFVFLLWISLRNALNYIPTSQKLLNSSTISATLVQPKPEITGFLYEEEIPFTESLCRDIFEETYPIRESIIRDSIVSDACESSAQTKGTESALSNKAFHRNNFVDAIGVGGRFGGRFGGQNNLNNNLNNNLMANTGVVNHEEQSGESYENYGVYPREITANDCWSTFATDVDTASYTLVRRKLTEGSIPPQAAVRVEEFVNFFDTGYEKNTKEWFQVHIDAAPSPFATKYHLLRMVVQGKSVSREERKNANLVFLVDTSGSMSSQDKIGLVKESLCLLVDSLQKTDFVSLCTYAGNVAIVLNSTPASEKDKIKNAIRQLNSGGGTSMGSGILNAYSLANVNFDPKAVNRVIICSDGDANIGVTRHEDILTMIEDYKNKGITLSTIGFGNGNYQDVMMEQLADKGNGNYYYIDKLSEAKRIFCTELTGTLEVIAKDMKVQVEFNPETVKTYRLIGYENRAVKDKDFRNDQVDGGEVGSGHTVTALYELELTQQESWLCNVFVRAKKPENEIAEELKFSYGKSQMAPSWGKASKQFRLIACVAEFAEILRENPSSSSTLEGIYQEINPSFLTLAPKELEFLSMLKQTLRLKGSALVR